MIRFSIKNPVVVNLLAISVVVIGIFSLIQLPREVFPPVSLNWVYIITPWPGASPENVEKLITVPLEEEIASVDGIESITSRSTEGRSVLSVKFESMPKSEFRAYLQDLQTEVNQVRDLPAAAEEPYVWDFTTDDFMPLVTVVLYGDRISSERLLDISKELQSELRLLDGVKDVNLPGERDSEIWVEVDPEKATAAGVSLNRVSQALAAQNVGIPVGGVDLGRRRYLLRMDDEFKSVEDVRATVVGGTATSGFVTVGDIARVTRTHEEVSQITHFNGKSALSLIVTKTSGESSLDVIDRVKDFTNEYLPQLPDFANLEYTFTGDSSRQINGILDILQRNAIVGMALVIVTLFFFLGLRNAFFAALGIPITFFVTFIFLHLTGNSFNGNSLFGLVLVLGVVVDDAIIVIENCYAYMQNGHNPIQAAYLGAKEVATPVIAATATTIAGFLPLMLMPGIMGQFLKIVPIVVSLALLASLLEAFLVLPSHFAEWSGKPKTKRNDNTLRRRAFRRLSLIYIPIVSKAIRFRYVVITIILAALMSAPALVNMLGVEMFRDEEFPSIIIQVRMPTEVKLEETERALGEMEDRLQALQLDDILGYNMTAGFMMTETEWYSKSSVGQIQLDLKDIDKRTISNDSLIRLMRSEFALVAGPISVDYMKIESGPPTGEPLEVKVKGKYLETLEQAARELRDSAATIRGLYDVRYDFEPGKRELRYEVISEIAARAGLTPYDIAREIMIAFEGFEATTFRDGDEEVNVIVKFPEERTDDFSALEQMKLVAPDGHQVALADLTRRVESVGSDEIRRFNQDRAITVSGKNDPDVIQLDKIAARVTEQFESISKKYPGYTLDFRGEWNEFKEAFSSLARLFVVGVLLIYMILGAQFKSFLQPFIIIFTIPFAIIGAMTGLLVSGDPFSISTMYGIVALAGVAVNDALVLVDFVNKSRQRGGGRYFSLLRAGKRRLRPILSTSITTIFGLLPMALGIGGKSVVWAPLATTIVWGLSVATILTLFGIPALYAITDDIKSKLGLKLSHQPHEL